MKIHPRTELHAAAGRPRSTGWCAALVLLIFCLITRKRMRFSLRDQFFMAIQGVTLFGLGYCMSYLATSYMTSGLVAVVYTTMLMWNILNLKLFMRQPVAWRAFWGGPSGLWYLSWS